MAKEKIIIVGGVAAGASAATRTRRISEDSEIILVEKGKYVSFANCGLPYYIGGVISEKDRLLIQTPAGIKKQFNIDVRIEQELVKVSAKTKTVFIKDLKTEKIYKEKYTKLVFATGAIPFIPEIAGSENIKSFVLRDIPDAEEIKKFVNAKKKAKVAILGGGPISVELSENLSRLGAEVSIIECSDHILSQLDLDMATMVENYLEQNGVDLRLNLQINKISKIGKAPVLELSDGTSLSADLLIYVAGIKPNSLVAKDAGIRLGQRGHIVVNEYFESSVKDIYAVGDVAEIKEFVSGNKMGVALAGPANKQGRLVADIMLGIKTPYRGALGSSVLKAFDYTVASTGLNERQLTQNNIKFKKVEVRPSSHAGYYPNSFPLTLSLLFGSKGELYGAQAFGREGVEKRIDVIATAIKAGMKVDDLADLDLCYSPPFSSAKDPVNMVAFAAQNILNGLVKTIESRKFDEISHKDIFILDVRTKQEFEIGHIANAVNISLDTIRERIHKIPKNKKIYVYCASGLRSYNACRILAQKGFNCYNLNGGYDAYKEIFGKGKELMNKKTKSVSLAQESSIKSATVRLDACGLSCPGPLQKVYQASKKMNAGDVLEVAATDPAFRSDVSAWAERTGNSLLSLDEDNGVIKALIEKGQATHFIHTDVAKDNGKTLVVFSDDIDRVIASFIIANGAAAMGREVTMFFTFWGLNVLRKPGSVPVSKDLISKAFGIMMPKGSKHLHLSQMNMGGAGTALIRWLMIKKNIGTLESLMTQAQQAGVKMIACSTSMDIMGIKKEELFDFVEIGGVATYLSKTEHADTNLFI